LSAILCHVRKKLVKSTPEELVRQALLEHFLGDFGCPLSLISVEISLANLSPLIPKHMKRRRIDIVCFSKTLDGARPLMLVECKRTQPSINAIAQLCGYNMYVHCPVIAVAWPGLIAVYTGGSLVYKGAHFNMPGYSRLQGQGL
jgi:hypothetical protein